MTAAASKRAKRFGEIVDAALAIAHEQGLGAMTLHEVARRVGLRQPSLYVYVASKLDLYDAMFAQANAELLARAERSGESGSAREQLLRLSRVVLDFAVEDPARQHLLFTRSIPGSRRRRSRTRWPSRCCSGRADCWPSSAVARRRPTSTPR